MIFSLVISFEINTLSIFYGFFFQYRKKNEMRRFLRRNEMRAAYWKQTCFFFFFSLNPLQAAVHLTYLALRAAFKILINNQGGPVKLVQHTYYRIIFKQNPFNVISRGVPGCTSTDFRLK